jgi:hypothetical protein
VKIRTISLILSSLSLATLAALATPIGGSMTSFASLTSSTTDTYSYSESWVGTPPSQGVIAYIPSDASSVLGAVVAYNMAADGNSGSVLLHSAWDLFDGITSASAEGNAWNYSFTADASGKIKMNYTLSLLGQDGLTSGLNGFYMTGDLGGHFFAAGNTSGQFLASVIAGNSYSFSLSTNANISGTNLNGYHGTMEGVFDWFLPGSSIVPDPTSTIGLLALSFAGLATLRRKIVRS